MEISEWFTEYGVWVYVLAGWNLLTFGVMGFDKRRATKGQRRVPEARLITMAICAGAVGILMGMKVFRHKTQKAKFQYGIPVILILQIVAMMVLIGYYGY